jgi:pyruvate dehydrogenase E1 component alpha subunit
MLPEISREQRIQILRTMLTIRRAEEHVIRFNEEHTGLIRGHFHVYIGQEATGAAVSATLGPRDYLFTTHRNHGHVIARGADPKRVLAEIIGRETGYCLGRAGTFHVAASELGIVHTSAIVGGCLPLAAGTAWAAQLRQEPRVTIVFFGDGAMEEGVFYETLNMARLWGLPVIFFMENNSRRTARGSSSHAATELADIPRAFNVETAVVDGADAGVIYHTALQLVQRARSGAGPFFVEARTEPWPGNAGPLPKLVAGITDIRWAWSPESLSEPAREWYSRKDPVLIYARELAGKRVVTRAEIEAIDREVSSAVDEAARFALASPLPQPEKALDYTFAGRNG